MGLVLYAIIEVRHEANTYRPRGPYWEDLATFDLRKNYYLADEVRRIGVEGWPTGDLEESRARRDVDIDDIACDRCYATLRQLRKLPSPDPSANYDYRLFWRGIKCMLEELACTFGPDGLRVLFYRT